MTLATSAATLASSAPATGSQPPLDPRIDRTFVLLPAVVSISLPCLGTCSVTCGRSAAYSDESAVDEPSSLDEPSSVDEPSLEDVSSVVVVVAVRDWLEHDTSALV